jgi:hypothetical protein
MLRGKDPLMNSAANQDTGFYDVVVIGGALSGAATATLLPDVQNRAANILFRDQHFSSSLFKRKKKCAFGFTQLGDLSSPFALTS